MIRQKNLHLKLTADKLDNLVVRLRDYSTACTPQTVGFAYAFNSVIEEVSGRRFAGVGNSDGRYLRVVVEHENVFKNDALDPHHDALVTRLREILHHRGGLIDQYVVHYVDRTNKYSVIHCTGDDLTVHSSKLQEEILRQVQSNILDCIANNKTTSGLFVPLHIYSAVQKEIVLLLEYYNEQYAPSMFGKPRSIPPIGGDPGYSLSHRAKVMYYYPDPVHTRVGPYHVNICITPDNSENRTIPRNT